MRYTAQILGGLLSQPFARGNRRAWSAAPAPIRQKGWQEPLSARDRRGDAMTTDTGPCPGRPFLTPLHRTLLPARVCVGGRRHRPA
jgi:hypothetical protein